MTSRMADKLVSSVLFFATLAISAPAATPAPAADFYQGKNVTLFINFAAGGPTDVEGRLVARHLKKYIPGSPNLIVQNMGGAGGANGTNYLAKVAKPDGLTLGFLTWNPLDPILDAPGIHIAYGDFKFIASARSAVMTYARKDTAPGIAVPSDIVKVKQITFGGIRPDVHTDLRARMALEMLGVSYKYTTGISGLEEAMLDLWRGEIQMTGTSLPGYRTQVEPQLVVPGIAIPLYQYAAPNAEGTDSRDPELPEVPTFLELYQQINGKDKTPSGVIWESFNVINTFFGNMNRIIVFPPKTDDQQVAVMRAAFVNLVHDKDFISDYEGVVKSKPAFLDGDSGQKIIANLVTVSPEVKSFLKSYVAKVIKK